MHDDDPEADPLEAALVARGREARDGDARWQALAEGRASAAEAQALAAEDPERFARSRPFDAAEDDALLDGALAAVAGRASADDPRIGPSALDRDPGDARREQTLDALAGRDASADPGQPRAEDLAGPVAAVIRPARWRKAVYVITPLALAAGLAFMLLRPGGPSPALPGYRLEDTSGDRATRSDDTARIVHPDARLRWVLRPANPVQPTVDARAFVVDGDRRTPLALDFEAAPGGALRADAPLADALPGRTGPVTLLIVIAPEPTLARLDPAALDPSHPPVDVRIVKHRLDIRPR